MEYRRSVNVAHYNIAFFARVMFVLSIIAIFSTLQVGEGQIQGKPNYIVHIQIGSSVPNLQSDTQASYEPKILPADKTKGIPVNSIVAWINDDESFHTVTSGSISKGPNNIFNSGILVPSVNWSWTFRNEGNFTYYCTIHPYMDGIIRVANKEQQN